MTGGIRIITGTSHPGFLDLVVRKLCIPREDVHITKFANGELSVDIAASVRDMDVFVVQTGFGPVNDLLMELMIMIHACKISSARRGTHSRLCSCLIGSLVVAVVPYFPYAKQCSLGEGTHAITGGLGPRRRSVKDFSPSSPEGAKAEIYEAWPVQTNTLVASMLMTAGADRFITMDLHDPQFQGFFDVPLENLPSLPMVTKCIRQHWNDPATAVIVSPDAGGAKRAAVLAEALGFDFALVHQDRRTGSQTDRSILIGSVAGRTAILVDDIADTSETLINAAELIHQQGARHIVAIITHGLFSGGSLDALRDSKIGRVFVSNSVPQTRALGAGDKFETFDVSCMFAEAIRRIHNGESVSHLFSPSAFQ